MRLEDARDGLACAAWRPWLAFALAATTRGSRHRRDVGQRQHLRVVAPEQIAHLVGQPAAVTGEVHGRAGGLAQLHDQRIGGADRAERVGVGAQAAAERVGIAGVVLGTSDSEAVTEAVELLWVDGVDAKAAVDQRVDHGAVRCLDGDGDLGGCCTSGAQQPVAELGIGSGAVRDVAALDQFAEAIEQGNAMLLAAPVEADEPMGFVVGSCRSFLVVIGSPVALRAWRDVGRPYTGALWRDLSLDCHRGRSAGAPIHARRSRRRVRWRLPADSTQTTQVIPAAWLSRRYRGYRCSLPTRRRPRRRRRDDAAGDRSCHRWAWGVAARSRPAVEGQVHGALTRRCVTGFARGSVRTVPRASFARGHNFWRSPGRGGVSWARWCMGFWRHTARSCRASGR